MAWNEPGGDKDRDPWRAGNGNQGPPDIDELIRNLQNRFGSLFGGKRPRGNGNGSVVTPAVVAAHASAASAWASSP